MGATEDSRHGGGAAQPHGLTGGQLLQRYRRRARLTQEELAEQGGYSANYISKLERDQRPLPMAVTGRLATALGLSRTEVEELQAARIWQGSAGPPAEPSLLAGRADEVAVLRRHLAGMEPRVLLFTGEPGIGKTRLLEEAASLAVQSGWRVVQGGCQRHAQEPYAPLTDALARSIQELPVPDRVTTLQGAGWLGLLLPELATWMDQISGHHEGSMGRHQTNLAPEQERRLLFAAVSRYVRAVAREAGTLLVLDDLHWAGPDALDLLTALATAAGSPPIRLIGAYRDSEMAAGSSLSEFVADLARTSLVRMLRLRPLSEAEAEQLLTRLIPEGDQPRRALLPAIVRRAGGVPFFLISYVEELRGRDSALPSLGLPWTVTQVIHQRVVALPAVTQELLGVAAMAGRVMPYPLLSRVTGRAEEEVLEALEAAADARLLEEEGEGTYRFTHDLIRETIERDLSAARRRLLHRRIGEALEQLSEPARQKRAAELAWHFMRADEPERALWYSVLAGDGAEAVYAHAEAERYYRTALELARERDDLPREAEVLQKLSVPLRILTRYEEALEALDQAAGLYVKAGDHQGEARTMREVAWVHIYGGPPDQGIVRVQAATERLERLPAASVSSRAGAELYTGLAICLWPLARYTEVLSAADRAQHMARMAKATHTLGVAETFCGMALTMVGPLPEARRVLEEAISLFDVEGDAWWLAQPWGNLGRAHVEEGDLQNGLRCLEQSRALIEAAHDVAEMAWIESNLGEVSYLQGDWSEARSAYERVIQLARDAGSDRYLSYALLHRAELCSTEGDWKQAAQDIDEGLDVAGRCAAVAMLRKGQRLLAERDVIEGRPQSAVDRLQPLLDQSIGEWPRAFPPPVLAEAFLELGDVTRPEELVLQRVQRFRAQNHRRALAVWLRVQGMVQGRQLRWDEADRTFAEAVSLAQAMPYPYAEGCTLYEYGQLHVHRGEPEQARERLAEALTIFRRLAARPYVERTEHALHDLR